MRFQSHAAAEDGQMVEVNGNQAESTEKKERRKTSYPGKKISTQEEKNKRVALITGELIDGKLVSEIKDKYAREWGVTSRCLSRYLKIARARIAGDGTMSKSEWRALQVARYLAIYAKDGVSDGEKIRALSQIDKLLGLEVPVPREYRHMGGDRGAIHGNQRRVNLSASVDLSSKLLESLPAIREAIRAKRLETIRESPQNRACSEETKNAPEAIGTSR